MGIVSAPRRLGAGLATDDSDTLALLDIDGLTIGTRCWNADVGAYFALSACVQTSIVLDPADNYDGMTDTWSFAGATFTGHEGDTLVIELLAPNAGYTNTYTIATVTNATDVVVTPAPAGDSSGELAGSVVLVENALETDVTVAAAGTITAVWRKAPVEPGTVEGITGETSNAVDNDDETNPVILDATASNAGTMSAADFTKLATLSVLTIKTKIVAGADASGGAVQTTFTGAVIGDKVVSVIDLDNLADLSADFETTISVTNKIVQSTGDLDEVTHILVQLLGPA